jgi:hypothetical protein
MANKYSATRMALWSTILLTPTRLRQILDAYSSVAERW